LTKKSINVKDRNLFRNKFGEVLTEVLASSTANYKGVLIDTSQNFQIAATSEAWFCKPMYFFLKGKEIYALVVWYEQDGEQYHCPKLELSKNKDIISIHSFDKRVHIICSFEDKKKYFVNTFVD